MHESNCRVSRGRRTPSTRRLLDGVLRFTGHPTHWLIFAQVAKLVDEAYSVCKETLAQNRPLLDATVDALLEKETIDGFELDALIEKYTGVPAPNPRPEAIAV